MESNEAGPPNGGQIIGVSTFRAAMKGYRQLAKISVGAMAKMLSKSPSFVSSLETGVLPIPRNEMVIKIGQALELNPAQLADFVVRADFERGDLEIDKLGYTPHGRVFVQFGHIWDKLSAEDQARFSALMQIEINKKGGIV